MSNETAEQLEAVGKEKLVGLLNDVFKTEESGWKFIKEKQGVKIYSRKQEGLDMNAWMGVGLVNAPPRDLWMDVGVNGGKTRSGWDKMLASVTPIEDVVPDKLIVANTVFKSPWPVWWRDFVACQYEVELEGDHTGCFVDLQWSIERTDFPSLEKEKKYIRAHNLGGGFVFQSVEGQPDQTLVAYTIAIDPRGWLPAWVVDQVSDDQVMIVDQVRKYWEKK